MSVRYTVRIGQIFLVLMALVGCGTTQTIDPVEANPTGFAPWSEGIPIYRFVPGDKVKVQFLLTPEMGETALVAPDGAISLRAAGRVQAAGLTSQELEAEVEQASRRVLTKPIVTISLEEAGGSVVLVGGSVARPGVYPLAGRRGVLESILLAGGFGDEARMTQVVLIRRNPENRPMLRTVDVRDFVSNGSTAGDVPLYAGDIVYVPRSRIAEANLWIDQYINRLIPFSRSFSYSVTRGSAAVVPF
ncbi:MAG TPA: polysaccharide biosynthesis/export family protein [Roseomonas sp.]|jgi:protein involved in polysaccharide export with SLBB domain